MILDPEALSARDAYGLLISVIQPRPIAWVSTKNAAGQLNLAPFSFFTGITAKPMSVCFCPVRNRDGKKKDTLVNVEATRQFVVNMVSEDLAGPMNQTSADYPYGVSEFEKAGLAALSSTKVAPPRVKGAPVSLECELIQTVTISEGPLGGTVVIGKVVLAHVDDAIWKDGAIHHRDLKAIGRLEGGWYAKTSADFELPRPRTT